MTIPFHIGNSAIVTLFGREGRIIKTDEHGYVFEGLKTRGQTERISFDDFERLQGGPDLRVEIKKSASSARFIEEKHGSPSIFAFASSHEQVRTLWRKACCDAFLFRYQQGQIRRTDADINVERLELKREADKLFGVAYYEAKATAGDDIPNKKFVSARQLRKWLTDYEAGGLNIDALVSKNHKSGNRLARFNWQEIQLMMEVIDEYAKTEGPTKKEAIRAVRDRFFEKNRCRIEQGQPPLEIPSKTKIFNILAAQSEYYMTVRRKGIDYANRKFTFKSKGLQIEQPGQRLEVDENKLDVISIAARSGILDFLPPDRIRKLEKLRRWLYVYIDCATRCILSVHLAEAQSGAAAVRALRDVFRNKTDLAEAFGCKHQWDMRCRPFEIIADHGSAFHSKEFTTAAGSLGVGVGHPPLGKAHLRPHIEGFFNTNNHLVMSHIISRTFSNSQERGDYPSEYLASLSDDELIGLIITGIVDIYHHRPLEGLDGYTPAQRWEQLADSGTVPIPPDGHEIRAALGTVYKRKVNNGGITLFKINYECPELRDAYLHKPGQKVKVRADLEDLGWVTVELRGKRFPARATWDVFDGMPYREWQATRREILKRKSENEAINQQTVIDAYARIDDTVRRAMLRAEVTPFYFSDADVERTERAMRLTLRDESHDPAAPLSELINPSPKSTNPLDLGEVIPPPKRNPKDSKKRTQKGRKWVIDGE